MLSVTIVAISTNVVQQEMNERRYQQSVQSLMREEPETSASHWPDSLFLFSFLFQIIVLKNVCNCCWDVIFRSCIRVDTECVRSWISQFIFLFSGMWRHHEVNSAAEVQLLNSQLLSTGAVERGLHQH